MSGTQRRRVVVIGAGVFGVTAATELCRRGHAVQLLDTGPVPRPEASSNDFSKAVRSDYGKDRFHTELASRALDGWDAWNRRWAEPLYHEVGILLLTCGRMEAGGFEADSLQLQRERGVPVERLTPEALGKRFPAWKDAPYVDGYFNPRAGFVESGRVMALLTSEAIRGGVCLREGVRCKRLLETDARVTGVVLDGGERVEADDVVVAAGAWTSFLLPWLSSFMWPTGQPVIHLRPPDPAEFDGFRFPVWCADITRTGWYGFPVTRDGVLKIGHHGPGRRIGPGDPLTVSGVEERRCLEFVRTTFAGLGSASIVNTRLCLYCDTWDGNFLIDRDPGRPGLIVATGGSGHGFKFAPVLGPIVADVVEGRDNADASRFRWREPGERQAEQARQRPTD